MTVSHDSSAGCLGAPRSRRLAGSGAQHDHACDRNWRKPRGTPANSLAYVALAIVLISLQLPKGSSTLKSRFPPRPSGGRSSQGLLSFSLPSSLSAGSWGDRSLETPAPWCGIEGIRYLWACFRSSRATVHTAASVPTVILIALTHRRNEPPRLASLYQAWRQKSWRSSECRALFRICAPRTGSPARAPTC